MATVLRAALAAAVLALGLGPLALAAGTPDPVVGTWTLNVAKSKFSPGPGPRSLSRVYAQDEQGTTLTLTGVNADGSPISAHSTFKYDGKDYPYTGSPNFDSLALQRVNATTVKSTLKRDGKPVGTSTRTLSSNGKVLTLKSKVTDPKGVLHEEVQVFDKQ
jgi:hypothetical protein